MLKEFCRSSSLSVFYYYLHLYSATYTKRARGAKTSNGAACGLTFRTFSGIYSQASPERVVLKFRRHVIGTGRGRYRGPALPILFKPLEDLGPTAEPAESEGGV